jgi:hypothetical protein
MTKREFFAVDDYGQGGVWLVIRAESADAIKAKYPELDVFDEPPTFLTSQAVERARAKRCHDLEDEPTGYLADIVADRRR